MPMKRGRPPSFARDLIRAGLGAPQVGEEIAADPLHRLGIEPRRGQGELVKSKALSWRSSKVRSDPLN